MKKLIIILVFVLLMLNIVNATPPTLVPISKNVISMVHQLKYQNSPNDAENLKKLLILYENNSDYAESYLLFKEAFLSYPNDLLLNYILLTPDKKYNPMKYSISSGLDAEIINEKKLYEVVPYVVDYLESNEAQIRKNHESFWKYLKIIGNYNGEKSRNFLRKLLSEINADYSTADSRRQIITGLSKQNDNESIKPILEFCKNNYLIATKSNNYDIHQSNYHDCLGVFQNYKNPEFIGFLLENTPDSRVISDIAPMMFPSFALDKSIYIEYPTAIKVQSDVLVKKWRDWHKENKNNIVWSEKAGKFIENGKENEILKYLNQQKISQQKKVGFFQRMLSWLRRNRK